MIAEFPFVENLPKREVKKIESIWDRVQSYQDIVSQDGAPITFQIAADLLGISKQRVYQLEPQAGFKIIPLPNGDRAIAYHSLLQFAKKQRSPGRPRTVTSEK